ncbi:hypothetical protein BJ508DRAFT_335954 [Ascobolus immersus RN42]|uniref:Uncharacterized protein n=1 Tax=Ascobolus immersus RN42 TaxID=1160509 RepID=A0A3N4HHK0_ASCIM|nr:hypothetical protein BJ508DRAFT_335954 [Ascobolus immersus RN42]
MPRTTCPDPIAQLLAQNRSGTVPVLEDRPLSPPIMISPDPCLLINEDGQTSTGPATPKARPDGSYEAVPWAGITSRTLILGDTPKSKNVDLFLNESLSTSPLSSPPSSLDSELGFRSVRSHWASTMRLTEEMKEREGSVVREAILSCTANGTHNSDRTTSNTLLPGLQMVLCDRKLHANGLDILSAVGTQQLLLFLQATPIALRPQVAREWVSGFGDISQDLD